MATGTAASLVPPGGGGGIAVWHDPAHEHLFAVVDPTGDLAGAAGDVDTAAAMFQRVTTLAGEEATKERVLGSLEQVDVLHVACHGKAAEEPLLSQLYLQDGDVTVLQMMGEPLASVRLAVLAACEAGVVGARLPAEATGFATALLQAGVDEVVCPLWPVRDDSTSLLLRRAYARMGEGRPVALALADAMRWLSEATREQIELEFPGVVDPVGGDRPYRHPDHWAAFTHLAS